MSDEHPEVEGGAFGDNYPDDELTEIDNMIAEGEETVLVRIIEWTEWIPGQPSPQNRDLVMNQGFTGFTTGKSERLLEVAVSGTGVSRRVRVKSENDDEQKVIPYSLYAFQAVLAQNVNESTFDTLMEAQRPPAEDVNSKQVIVTKHMPNSQPPSPPRKKKRNR